MTLRMFVDALHEEETRVVIADDANIIDFDVESSAKKQIKGNVYLAKVTRVEPSLQAAFLEYGGGRQAFLPFSEIHPDYYQIPVADKQELLKAQAEERVAAQRAEEAEYDRPQRPAMAEVQTQDAQVQDASFQEPEGDAKIEEITEEKVIEDLGGDEAFEDRPRRQTKRYKIQEVIKKNQVMLIQIIKEERGNKGASVTTYISLPGRYCVLMPNTAHGGGVSRKIGDSKERRKLKEVLDTLEMADGMSIIIRTAGMGHTQTDIHRDYSYLIRLWNKIREQTLSSVAPALVYEEGSVIKRSIRDFYGPQVAEIVVAGKAAVELSRDFMKMIMPTSVKKIKEYDEAIPLFNRYGLERQLLSMYDSTVVMPSGGYIVINSTEAMISIDVNSGRSTGERNVEDTATRTNIEAAVELARQLRLRDLAGLIVIDFIDMLDSRHRRQVERALKDALRADRAKIQVGRISPFGLLEMSRQRLRPSLHELHMIDCPTCKGAGHIRSDNSSVLHLLRSLENELAIADFDGMNITKVYVTASASLCLNFLNIKRRRLSELEAQYNFQMVITPEEMPSYSFKIQIEDAAGAKTRLLTSDDRDSRLPQSRGESKSRRGGNNNKKPRFENSPPPPVLKSVDTSDSYAEDLVEEVVTEGEVAAPRPSNNQRDRRDRYDRRGNRGGRGRNNRNRGDRDNRQPNPNAGEQPRIEGEVVPHYQQEQGHIATAAEVYDFEPTQKAIQEDYPNQEGQGGDDDQNQQKRGGWWRKIIE